MGDSQGWVAWQHVRGKNLRLKTLQSYQGYLDNHLLPAFGPRTLRSLAVRELDNFFISLPRSNATKNKILHVLRLVLQEACDQQLITTNIARDVKSFVEDNQHPAIFTPAELAQLFPTTDVQLMHIWKAYSWAVFFRVMAVEGLRPGPFELVFTVPATGAMIGPMTSSKVLRGALKRVGLDTSKTQYGLRHTFQTHALQILSRDQVADIMGHVAYHQDYDQRNGEAMLRQYQGLRAKMPDLLNKSG